VQQGGGEASISIKSIPTLAPMAHHQVWCNTGGIDHITASHDTHDDEHQCNIGVTTLEICHNAFAMASPQVSSVKLGRQGRLVIPAPLRQELGLAEGDELIARVENGQLVFEPRERLIARLRSRFKVREASLASELMNERREDATRE
jgi:AbrB family looped-hinge helix DNA binding protein